MAESSDKISPSKRPLNFLLRCFGSFPEVESQKNLATGRRDRRIQSLRFRFKKSSATVPVDSAVPEITLPCDDKASFSPELKKHPPPPSITSRAPAVRAEIVESIKPSQTRKKTESAKRTAALLHSVSLPSRRLNRQKDSKKTVSQPPSAAAAAAVATTSPESSDLPQPAPKNSPAKKFDPVIVIVVVAIVVLWGRLCATLCTVGLFYFSRRLRSEVDPDCGRERRVLNREGSGFGKISGEV